MSYTTPRTRTRGALMPVTWLVSNHRADGVTTSSSGICAQGQGTTEIMHDMVERPFRAGVDIVNFPMDSRVEHVTFSPLTGQQTWTGTPEPWTIVTIQGSQNTGNLAGQTAAARSRIRDTTDDLITQACTQALASVDKPEVFGLVAIKEAKATLAGLINPLKGAAKFLDVQIGRQGRKVKRSKKLRDSAKAIADQHLSVVFGLMPFIADVQGTLKSLEEIEPLPIRKTARGSASWADEEKTLVTSEIYRDANTRIEKVVSAEVKIARSVRAYILYEVQQSLVDKLGVRPQDVPLALWQTATLSFVVDWFVNVGQLISALTPRVGIKTLASGYTVSVVDASSVGLTQNVIPYTSQPGYAGKWIAEQTNVILTKSRVPSSLSSHVGLALKRRSDADALNTGQITSLISLITQKLAQLR